jgi:hypothetical protein
LTGYLAMQIRISRPKPKRMRSERGGCGDASFHVRSEAHDHDSRWPENDSLGGRPRHLLSGGRDGRGGLERLGGSLLLGSGGDGGGRGLDLRRPGSLLSGRLGSSSLSLGGRDSRDGGGLLGLLLSLLGLLSLALALWRC